MPASPAPVRALPLPPWEKRMDSAGTLIPSVFSVPSVVEFRAHPEAIPLNQKDISPCDIFSFPTANFLARRASIKTTPEATSGVSNLPGCISLFLHLPAA
jgi:hypothetical protein